MSRNPQELVFVLGFGELTILTNEWDENWILTNRELENVKKFVFVHSAHTN